MVPSNASFQQFQRSWNAIKLTSNSYLMLFVGICSSLPFDIFEPFWLESSDPDSGQVLTQRFSTDDVDSLGRHIAIRMPTKGRCTRETTNGSAVIRTAPAERQPARKHSKVSNWQIFPFRSGAIEFPNMFLQPASFLGAFWTHIPADSGMESELNPWSNEWECSCFQQVWTGFPV